jgi:hypothetical protein
MLNLLGDGADQFIHLLELLDIAVQFDAELQEFNKRYDDTSNGDSKINNHFRV